MGRVGILPLQKLSGSERRAGVGESAQLVGILVEGELGERAREQEVAGGDRSGASCDSCDGRVPPAQQRTVDQVIVDERGGMHELDRHRGSHEALLPLPTDRRAANRLGRQHDEQGAQALAPCEDRRVGVFGEGASRAGGDALQMTLDAGHALA